ncbi:MAG: dihydrodipicolinate synthase family protein [Waddliaceae bacterium]
MPHRAGSHLHIDVIRELKNHPNFWAIKEASGSIETFQLFAKEAPHVLLFSGNDDSLPKGAHGLVSVMGNLWPHEVNAYVKEKSSHENWKKAARLSNECNPVMIKRYLYEKGIISSDFLKPPLSPKDGGNLSALMEAEEQLGIGKLREALQ